MERLQTIYIIGQLCIILFFSTLEHETEDCASFSIHLLKKTVFNQESIVNQMGTHIS